MGGFIPDLHPLCVRALTMEKYFLFLNGQEVSVRYIGDQRSQHASFVNQKTLFTQIDFSAHR